MATRHHHRTDALLAQLIIEAGLLDAATVAECQKTLSSQENAHLTLDRLCVEHHQLAIATIGQLLSHRAGVPYQSLSANGLLEGESTVLLQSFPEGFAALKQALPLSRANGCIQVATPDPSQPGLADEITLITGLRPNWVVTTPMELIDALSVLEASRFKQGLAQSNVDESSIVSVVEELLHRAFALEASDIHIEPRLQDWVIRFRIQGVLEPIQTVSQSVGSAVISRLKVLSKLDVVEHRRPQEGQFRFPLSEGEAFCRVSFVPVTDQQEKASIRLLKPLIQGHCLDSNLQGIEPFKPLAEQGVPALLAELGLSDWDWKQLQTLLATPSGMVVACGPTGTGKSTTLYTLLQLLNGPQRNLCTVEDPIERRIDGINQIPLNSKLGITYETAIKALLRQDPDVIMVGEIRDETTLSVSVQAALTGHLILTSFHANSAATAVTRMMDLNVSSKLLSSALSGIIAQRLVRTLCPHCKQAMSPSDWDRQFLFPYDEQARLQSWEIFEAVGCSLCQGKGYVGRTGVFEIMVFDRELRYLVSQNTPELQLEDAAIAAGMRTLSLNGRMKVLQGITSLAEVRRVLGSVL
ncbi:MAG: ATPase, T2SS/T4P/T4SS family [Vampirovibrionales bacterium]